MPTLRLSDGSVLEITMEEWPQVAPTLGLGPRNGAPVAKAVKSGVPSGSPRKSRRRSNGATHSTHHVETVGPVGRTSETALDTGWRPPTGVAEFYRRLSERQRLAIQRIATAARGENGVPGEIASTELQKLFGLKEPRKLTEFLGTIRRMADTAMLDWSDVVHHRFAGARSERITFYSAGPLLRGEDSTHK